MTTAVKVLYVDAHDLGATPHQFKKDDLLNKELTYQFEYDTAQSKHPIIRIQLGTNNQYTIDEQLIKAHSDCEVYDNQTKILEWHFYEDGTLVVQSYTEKQINLLAALKAKKCLIKATGPLFINGALDAESIVIDADALWFSGPVTAEDSVGLKVRQGVGFFAPVTAKQLTINAAYVHQQADLQVSELWDVSTQFFKQDTAVKASVKVLRLIAAQCEMKGDLTVNGQCFLTANTLVWGDETAQTTFRFLGKSYMRADSLHLKGDMQVRIQNSEAKNIFNIGKKLIVDEHAAAVFTKTLCNIESINSEGQLSFEDCTLSIHNIEQYGIADFKQSSLHVKGTFSQRKEAITELDQCVFNTPTINVYGGEFNMTQCLYNGHVCNVYRGSLTLQKESNIELKELFVETKAAATINNCLVKSNTSIVALGTLSFDKATVATKYLTTLNGTFSSNHSKVTVAEVGKLKGVTDLAESELLVTKRMTIEGDLSINKAQLNADFLEIKCKKAQINSLRSTSKHFQLHGNKVAEQVVFHDAALITLVMSCVDHATFDSSVIYGVPEKLVTHDLRSRLKLKNSKFITENDIRNHQNGIIELEDNSFLKVGLLHSQGAMKAKDSGIFCQNLLQENADSEFETSAIHVEKGLTVRSGTMELKAGSKLTTSMAELLDTSTLIINEDSTFIAQSTLINEYGSKVTSSSSKLVVNKFKSLGHTELCSSLLSANELEVYDKFVATSSTNIMVEGLITVAEKAHAQLDKSLLVAQKLALSGTMQVDSSALEVKQDLKTSSSSTLVLKGEAKVQAETMSVRGVLEIQATPAVDKEAPNATPQIKVNKELYIAEKATVKGDADLQVDADELLNSGTVSLTGKVKATGRLLTNYGSMSADNICLGFDDNVRNLGTLSAEELVIHSSLMNLGGQIYTRKSLSTAGLYNLNLGLIAANNYSNSSLFSLNAGLNLPNFSADFKYIFTKENGLSLAKITATALFPQHTNSINIASLLLRRDKIKDNAVGLYKMCNNFDWQRYNSMRRHELIAEFCQFKGYMSSAYSTFNLAYSTAAKLSDLGDELSNMKVKLFDVNNYSMDNFKSLFTEVDYVDVSKLSAGVFLGNYNENALISANLGCNLAIDTSKRSLLAFNAGLDASLLSHNVQSEAFFNSGWAGGTDTTIQTRFSYNMGTIEGFNQLTLSAEHVINKGTIEGNNARVAINELSQEGKLALRKGQAKIDQFKDTKEADSSFTDMRVSGINFDADGHLEADNVGFVYDNKFEIKEHAQANLQQVVIKTHEYKQVGQVNFEKLLSIEADKAYLQKGAVLKGKQTDEKELYVTKAKDDSIAVDEATAQTTEEKTGEPSAATPEEQKEFKPQHILQLKVGEHLGLDASLQGGDYVQIQGKSIEPTEPSQEATESSENKEKVTPKCGEIIIGDNANINIGHGSIDAKKVVNSGAVDLNKVALSIDDLTQSKQMKLDGCVGTIGTFKDNETASTDIKSSSLEGTVFTSTGRLDAQSSRFKYSDKMALISGSQATTDNVEIIAGTFEHSGTLDYQNLLSVKATKVVLHDDSTITGKKTPEDELFVIKAQPTSTGEASVEGEQEQKEFKPKHILDIQAEQQVEMNGSLTGGDYTAVRGKQESTSETTEGEEKKTKKVEQVVIGDNAHINLNHGAIDTNHLVNNGQTELSNFSLDVDKLEQYKKLTLNSSFGQINELVDSETARTEIYDSTIKGDTFRSKGELDARHTIFDYKKSFVTEKSSHATTDNVQITTGLFEHAGKIDYQNRLAIKSNHADLQKGSSIVGKQTSEDELFVPKVSEGTGEGQPTTEQPSQSTSEAPEAPKEPEKEFKPQHIAILETNTGVLNGEFKGGDYTAIKGKTEEQPSETATSTDVPVPEAKSESLTVGESADIDLRYGSIHSKQLDLSSKMQLKNFSLDINKTTLNQGGILALSQSTFSGDELHSSGLLTLDGSLATFNQDVELSQCARETLKDSRIVAKQFIDHSQMSYQGQSGVFADHYEHTGKITQLNVPEGELDKNLFYVKAKTAHLAGAADLDNGLFDIEHFADANQFIAGQGLYSNYKASKSLEVDTLDYVTLNSAMSRDCDLTVKASGITMAVDYNKGKALNLISTETDVNLLSTIHANSVYVKSARDIRTNHETYANDTAHFEADGGFYNQGGVINANVVGIKAKEIKNISAGSYAATSAGGVPMGTGGVINGRKDVYLEATGGDIVNYGGLIRSGNYTQLIAQGNVLNACNIRTTQGAYGAVTSFDSGLIAGGSGSDTEGFGLYIKAGGKVTADASNFISNGNNYIEGDQGIEFTARQETHISDITRTRKWYGKTKETITTKTTVTNSTVQSGTGVNVLKTEHGGVKSVATNFISPGGTQIFARDDVSLYSLKTQNHQYTSSSSFWGLSKRSISELHEDAIPTLFIDNGVTRIQSELGSIDARGAYFCGNGDLDMQAKNGRIKFGADILNHDIVEKSRSLGVSVPGMGAWSAWKSTGNVMSVLTAEDATLAKLDAMLNSGNKPELLANSANLGINLYNTTNSLARGFANDTLKDELLARYGLGGADSQGFVPIFSLSMTENTSRSQYQTQGVGGVNRGGNVYLEAGEGIDLENGVRVHAGGNMVVNAPEVIATAAALHSSFEQTTKTQSIGFTPTGQIQDASLGYSHSSSTATQYQNAELSAGGTMKLGYHDGAMRNLTLDGAVIKAGSMDAAIEHLTVIDKQDLSASKTESFSASFAGQVSAYKGQGDSATVREHSGIFINDNTGHAVTIDEANMTGGKIQTSGGDLSITKLTTQQVVDHSTYSGVGISFNVNDLQRLAGQEATNQTGEQAIAIAEVTVDKVNYQAEHTAVVYGDNNAYVDIKETVGQVHTDSADGTKVIKNDEVHLNLDIPLTNRSYIEKSAENLQEGMKKLSDVLGLNEPPETELPSVPEEPALPSRRNEEEEEEEEEVGEKPADESGVDLEKQKKDALSSEEFETVWKEVFNSLSAEDKQAVDQLKNKLINEYETESGVSLETANELKKKMLSAINQVMKAGSEDLRAKLVKAVGVDSTEKIFKMLSSSDALSKINTKLYLGSHSIFISFTFNLFGASIDGDKDVWNRAVKNTAGDMILNFAIKTVATDFSGPVGWSFVGIGVFDALFYDENITKVYGERGSELYQRGFESLRKGDYFTSIELMKIAQANAQLAGNMELMHAIANTGAHIGDAVGDVWGKISGKGDAPAPKSSPVVNRNSFFKPASSASKVNQEQQEQCTPTP